MAGAQSLCGQLAMVVGILIPVPQMDMHPVFTQSEWDQLIKMQGKLLMMSNALARWLLHIHLTQERSPLMGPLTRMIK